MTNEFNMTHVKILVHTPPVDGYPPEEWEGLWAIPVENGHFKIDNIPFYAKNLSCGDVVEVSHEGDEYVFQRVIEQSEHSTIRVIIYDLAEEINLRKGLVALGCSIEGTGTSGLIAINVPKESIDKTINTLQEALREDKLDFEEGALRL